MVPAATPGARVNIAATELAREIFAVQELGFEVFTVALLRGLPLRALLVLA